MPTVPDGPDSTPTLAVDGLGKRYGRRCWAVRDCTLTVPRGRIAGIVGPNGAGKTTLLHLAIGLLRPTRGRVWLLGEPVHASNAVLPWVGFVAQDHPLYASFTVADLLHFGRSLNPNWDRSFALRRLAELGISLQQRTGKLSGGQQIQVALTLALAKRPRLLVLDEPVASLDPLARREFMQAMVDAVAGEGLTVLLSSHSVAELERVCDYLILLRAGRVRLAGDIDDVLATHRLLVGPRGEVPDHLAGVVTVTHGARHSNLLARLPAGVAPHPRWESHPVSLEDIVLAYLRQAEPSTEPAAAVPTADGERG